MTGGSEEEDAFVAPNIAMEEEDEAPVERKKAKRAKTGPTKKTVKGRRGALSAIVKCALNP